MAQLACTLLFLQNVLRSQRDGVIKSVKAKPGDALRVDQVIVEFQSGEVPQE
jgi:acetyl/propionyl-CoA carboxylase alpha subunit